MNENHISIMSLSVSIRNLKFKVEKLITLPISTNSAKMINVRNILATCLVSNLKVQVQIEK